MTSTSDDVSTKKKRVSKPKGPKPPSLQERVIAELTRSRDAGAPHVTARELAERCGEPVDKFPGKLAGKAFEGKVVIAKKVPTAPVALADDPQTFANSDELLRFAVAEAKTVEPGPWEVAKFLKLPKLDKAIATKFQEALETRVGNGTLPSDLRDQIVPKRLPPPKPPKPVPLPERIVQELNRLKSTHGTYPITATGLAQNLREPAEQFAGKLAGKALHGKVVIAKKRPSALVALAEDLELLANSDSLLRFAVSEASAKKPGPWTIDAFLKAAALEKSIATTFRTAIESIVLKEKLPADLRDQIVPKALPLPKPPKPETIPTAEIASNLLAVLRSQRPLGGDSYPAEQTRLLELCDVKAKVADKKKGLTAPGFLNDCVSIKAGSKTHYLLKSDVLVRLDALISIAAQRPAGKAGAKSNAFAIDDLVTLVASKKSAEFKTYCDAIVHAIEHRKLPAAVGVLYLKGKPILYCQGATQTPSKRPAADIEPSATKAPTPQSSNETFSQAFDSAFKRVLARTGGRNLVKVFDLRQELRQFNRQTFDAGLTQLREAGRFTMDSYDGTSRKLSDDEVEAGIREGGATLVYVSRKDGSHG